jgi:VanZ family protein
MMIIFAASTDLMSSERTSRIIGPIARWFSPDISAETIRKIQFIVRKGAHVAEYAVLALLVWWAWRKSRCNALRSWRWGDAGFAVMVCALVASVDELHQHFVPTRHGSIWDVLLDASGAAMAMLLLWFVGRKRNWW